MSRFALVLLHPPSVYDFREEPILYGPISDVVPSTPIFEMYPIGFSTIAAHLERFGYPVRIINLAVRMMRDPSFRAEKAIASLKPLAFGIDLHWLCHAQGALEVAKLVKECHPEIPVILGGFSASYYYRELLNYPQVDYVVRGDSTEEPLRQLIECLGGRREPEGVPNLAWRDRQGRVRESPLSYVPADLDALRLDYGQVVKAVVRDRDISSYTPFIDWLEYPAMAGLSCRGCIHNCVTCGGSAVAFQKFLGRSAPAYRDPEKLAKDVRDIQRFSKGPVFILGDIRQASESHARKFLRAAKGIRGPIMMEFFSPASRNFLEELTSTFPDLCLEISLESHDPRVRQAFGRNYTNEAVEKTIEDALDLGCRRFDVFFMVGLPYQTPGSVMETVDYCEWLLERYGGEGRLSPFISPLAPFLDPGSLAFENPERYGYRLFHRTLEEHRQALLQPSWKYMLNYETEWMTREEIVDATYRAAWRLNRMKEKFGLITAEQAEFVEDRIGKAMKLVREIDEIMASGDARERKRRLETLKPQIDEANSSTVCEETELKVPIRGQGLNVPETVRFLLADWCSQLRGRLGRSGLSESPK